MGSSQMSLSRAIRSLTDRIDRLTSHLEDDCCGHLDAQLHLDHETSESAYWHAGYRAALIDALRLMQAADAGDRRLDSISGFPSDAPDGGSYH